jgi:hypothetical protein
MVEAVKIEPKLLTTAFKAEIDDVKKSEADAGNPQADGGDGAQT